MDTQSIAELFKKATLRTEALSDDDTAVLDNATNEIKEDYYAYDNLAKYPPFSYRALGVGRRYRELLLGELAAFTRGIKEYDSFAAIDAEYEIDIEEANSYRKLYDTPEAAAMSYMRHIGIKPSKQELQGFTIWVGDAEIPR